MKKNELLAYASIDQLISVKRCEITEGVGKGNEILEVKCGLLSLSINVSKGLDIFQLEYRGINLSYLCKNGNVSAALIHSNARDFYSGFAGGMLYTCGLEPRGVAKIMHGGYSSSPAENVSVNRFWVGDALKLIISGQTKSTELFGKHLVVTRTIGLTYGSSEIEVNDAITNEGFTDTNMFMLYHWNFGYPFLDKDCVVEAESFSCTPRTDWAREHFDKRYTMQAPSVMDETVYFLNQKLGNISIISPNTKLKATLEYNTDKLPVLIEWRCMRSGDYALGLEPATSGLDTEPDGVVIKVGETRTHNIKLSLTDIS